MNVPPPLLGQDAVDRFVGSDLWHRVQRSWALKMSIVRAAGAAVRGAGEQMIAIANAAKAAARSQAELRALIQGDQEVPRV